MINTNVRIGHGFDVHKFSAEFDAKKPLILGGYQLDSPYSLIAHSDGDVVLHALCDALLGAAALGDSWGSTSQTLTPRLPVSIVKRFLNLC